MEPFQKKPLPSNTISLKERAKSIPFDMSTLVQNHIMFVTVLVAKASASSSKDYAWGVLPLPSRGICVGKCRVHAVVCGVGKKFRNP